MFLLQPSAAKRGPGSEQIILSRLCVDFFCVIRMLKEVLDRLLPQFCAVCEIEGAVLCDACIRRIDVSGVFLCPVCNCPNAYGAVHPACTSSLDGVVSVTHYSSIEVQQMIRLCKYFFIERMADVMGTMMSEAMRAYRLFDEQAVLFPVPLSRVRYAQRGFNQSVLLARAIGDRVGIRVDESVIMRHRHAPRQVDLVEHDRAQNVSDAFLVIKTPPKMVVLIDDVATTCSTLAACASVLKDAGVASVWGFTFARG